MDQPRPDGPLAHVNPPANGAVFNYKPASPVDVKDRLTVLLAVRHEHCCEDPVSVDAGYEVLLETMEQPYQRRLRVGEHWLPLETAWLKATSCIIIENPKHPPRPTNPTPAELEADAAAIIEFGYEGHPPYLVRPGRATLFEPTVLAGLRIRCQRGNKEVNLTVMPG